MTLKLLALGIGGAYAAYAVHIEMEPFVALRYLVATIVALALIWFPEQAGSVTGVGLGHGGISRVDQETPGCVVAVFGWMVLLGVALVYWGLR